MGRFLKRGIEDNLFSQLMEDQNDKGRNRLMGHDQPHVQDFLEAVDRIGPGTVLVHHCNSALTAEALPVILQGLQERGYEAVPLSALLEDG